MGVFAEIFGPEGLIVLAIILLIFGASRLPQLARSVGLAKGEFEKGLKEGNTPTDAAKDPAKDTTVAEKKVEPTE